MKLLTLVVDDEELSREYVRGLVLGDPRLQFVGEATDGREALDRIAELQPDLVFLDIQMPELDGFQVVSALANPIPAIVFVTAYDAFAIQAFEVDAIDYLLKPVRPDRFSASVQRVVARRSAKPPVQAVVARMEEQRGPIARLVASRGSKHYFVQVANIDWIEAEGNYIRLVTGPTSHLIRDTMKGMEVKLPADRFVRVHRSAMVAIDRIATIEARENGDYSITMASGARIETGRAFSENVRRLLR